MEGLLTITDGDFNCSCGNRPIADGFQPCDVVGAEVEPTAEAWPLPLYVCSRCRSIYHVPEAVDGKYPARRLPDTIGVLLGTPTIPTILFRRDSRYQRQCGCWFLIGIRTDLNEGSVVFGACSVGHRPTIQRAQQDLGISLGNPSDESAFEVVKFFVDRAFDGVAG